MCFNSVTICKGGIGVQIYCNGEKIEKYLDDLSEEYKELLLKRLLETSGSIDNLKVSDLLKIDTEIKKPLMSDYRRRQRKQRILLCAGLMYAAIGILLLLLFQMIESYSYDTLSLMALIITSLGLFISIFSLLFPINGVIKIQRNDAKNISEDDRVILEYDVVKTWRELEGVASDLYIDRGLLPTQSLISLFLKDNYINESEAEILKDFLKMRNNIVHSMEKNYSLEEIINALKSVNMLIKNLKEKI